MIRNLYWGIRVQDYWTPEGTVQERAEDDPLQRGKQEDCTGGKKGGSNSYYLQKVR